MLARFANAAGRTALILGVDAIALASLAAVVGEATDQLGARLALMGLYSIVAASVWYGPPLPG
jgi:hypothetical protein